MNKTAITALLGFMVGILGGLLWGAQQIEYHKEISSKIITSLTAQHQREISEERARAVEDFRVEIWEATGYAPLDPDAVNGICYAGDPNITASGQPVYPGVTVAAGPDIPFGTWLWIEGFGWRRVDDRGGKIKNGRVDICFISRQEALKFGRQKVVVVIPEWDEEGEN